MGIFRSIWNYKIFERLKNFRMFPNLKLPLLSKTKKKSENYFSGKTGIFFIEFDLIEGKV